LNFTREHVKGKSAQKTRNKNLEKKIVTGKTSKKPPKQTILKVKLDKNHDKIPNIENPSVCYLRCSNTPHQSAIFGRVNRTARARLRNLCFVIEIMRYLPVAAHGISTLHRVFHHETLAICRLPHIAFPLYTVFSIMKRSLFAGCRT
jgi:hypothetical protein